MKIYDNFLSKIYNFFNFTLFLSKNIPKRDKFVIFIYDKMTKIAYEHIII